MAQAGRFLEWDGCFNARDLGGVGQVVPGAAVRADRLDRLTGQGWTTVVAHGVRTVVDLRNDDEVEGDRAPRPDLLTTVRITPGRARTPGLLGRVVGDPGFGTPAYFQPFLERFPDRVAAVARAIADAPPGGVAFHCGLGRDRTGIIALVLLRLAGASPRRSPSTTG